MGKLILLCTSLGAMLLLISASPVGAQTTAWVSPTGSGTNCFEVSPCANFQTAIATGASQINCLGSGLYGGGSAIMITQSVTIDCGAGNVGMIDAFANTAIAINTTAPATVILRHLSLNGVGGTSNAGIAAASFSSGALIIEDCTIQGFASGADFRPNAGRGLLKVSNTQILNNATGILVAPGNGQIASLTLNRVELVGNSNIGLRLSGAVVAGTMKDSVVSASTDGVYADGGQVFFAIDASHIAANVNVGVFTTSAGAVIGVGTSTFAGNLTGVNANLGSIVSFGNNQMIANGSDGNFTGTKPLR
jgi:hypothetical protein